MVQTKKIEQCYLSRFGGGRLIQIRAMLRAVPRPDVFKCWIKSILLCGLLLSFFVQRVFGEAVEPKEPGPKAVQGSSGVESTDASPPRTAALASRLNRRMASSLWDGRIAVVAETEQQKRDRHELQKLIERINGVSVSQKKQTSVPTGGGTAQVPTEPRSKGAVVREEPDSIDAKATPPVPSVDENPARSDQETGALSAEILLKVMKLSNRPEALMDPFAIAEILYASGHLPEAAQFYDKALERIDQEDAPDADKRAWIIFQNGNSLRQHQPAQAVEMYQMLMREYPDSPWKEAAQIWLALANWYNKEKPQELIRECEQLKLSVNRVLSELDS
jgi:tetratricopeptide (TPR) repeat protein